VFGYVGKFESNNLGGKQLGVDALRDTRTRSTYDMHGLGYVIKKDRLGASSCVAS
jgi:hypothetical protein